MLVDELIQKLPSGDNKDVMDWLYQIFVHWQQGPNTEITNRRNEIANRVCSKTQLAPNSAVSLWTLRLIEPGDLEAVDLILGYGLSVLVEEDAFARLAMIPLFLNAVTHWRTKPEG